MANNNSEFGRRLWEAADQLRANSKLRAGEYSVPVLGLIFLKYADCRFEAALRETRDLLLPRLISGEISVEGLPLPEEN